jgi:hypothetical protein
LHTSRKPPCSCNKGGNYRSPAAAQAAIERIAALPDSVRTKVTPHRYYPCPDNPETLWHLSSSNGKYLAIPPPPRCRRTC